jgi:hypothetical protein
MHFARRVPNFQFRAESVVAAMSHLGWGRLFCHTCMFLSRRAAAPGGDGRARPEDVVAGSGLVFPVRRLAPDGLDAWTQVIERGYEGYVAKNEASVYEGGATRRWVKVKQKDWTVKEDGWRWRMNLAPAR